MKPDAGRVVVTGVGLVSSLGDSLDELHAALCEGRSALRPLEDSAGMGLPPLTAADLPNFEPRTYLGSGNLRPLDRTGRLSVAAAALALADAGLDEADLETREVGLVLGTMFGSIHTISEFDRRAVVAGPNYAKPMQFANSVINAAAGQTAIWHNLRGVNATISGGVASGVNALAYATDLIHGGQADVLLAGGADEFCFESLHGFFRAGLLCASGNGGGHPIPFDSRRNGLCLGEGAALMMLETLASARARDATILAEIAGTGSSFDASRGRDRNRATAAVARSLEQALGHAALEPGDIDCLSASANGSVDTDDHEAWGIHQAFGDGAARLPVTAVKSMLGETLGTSGAIQTLALIEAMRSGCLPGIRGLEQLADGFPLPGASAECRQLDMRCGLVNAVGIGGNARSLIVRRWDPDSSSTAGNAS